jgi:hypothetical protein
LLFKSALKVGFCAGVASRYPQRKRLRSSALTGFEPALRLVDDVNAAFATHNTAIAMPILERAERIANLHGRLLMSWRGPAPGLRATCQRQVDE